METNIERISPRTKLYGIFGNPVSHSLSPIMHNIAFSHSGIEGVYLAFQILPNQMEDAFRSIKALGIQGVNVTVPYKNCVLPYLDEIRGEAALTGSVNTIHNENGRLIGYSTDGAGLLCSLKEEANWRPEGESVIILGTGGAATAVAFSMSKAGISRLMIVARSNEKGKELSDRLLAKTGVKVELANFAQQDLAERSREYSLVINSTPVGMSSRVGESKPPFSPSWIRPDGICCDLIYNPLKTEWLKEAELSDRRILSGLGMLVFQGAESFKIWTGCEMPILKVRQRLTTYLQGNLD